MEYESRKRMAKSNFSIFRTLETGAAKAVAVIVAYMILRNVAYLQCQRESRL